MDLHAGLLVRVRVRALAECKFFFGRTTPIGYEWYVLLTSTRHNNILLSVFSSPIQYTRNNTTNTSPSNSMTMFVINCDNIGYVWYSGSGLHKKLN